jgi:NADH dehydrogenase
MNVLVIGGTGFVGREIVGKLVQAGHRVHVPTRRYAHGRPLMVYPTVTLFEADVHDDAKLDDLVRGNDVVINLVGILHSRQGSPYGPDFERAHVQLPARIAKACVSHGVAQLIHVSALGASEQGPSAYSRSKADGEKAIRQVLAGSSTRFTIFRPSVVFGRDDQFMNMFARLAKVFPVLPLAGARAKLQPIYVGDVAQAVTRVVGLSVAAGKTYDLAGPRAYALGELVKLASVWSGHPRPVFEMPMSIGRIQAALFEMLPGQPIMSRDNLDSLKVDNVSDRPMDPDLNLVPTPLESVAPSYLR